MQVCKISRRQFYRGGAGGRLSPSTINSNDDRSALRAMRAATATGMSKWAPMPENRYCSVHLPLMEEPCEPLFIRGRRTSRGICPSQLSFISCPTAQCPPPAKPCLGSIWRPGWFGASGCEQPHKNNTAHANKAIFFITQSFLKILKFYLFDSEILRNLEHFIEFCLFEI